MQEGGGGGRFASSCRGRGLLYWQVERTRTGSWREKLGCGQGSGSSCGAALPTHTPISCGQLAPTAAAAMFFSSQCHSLFALTFLQLSSYAFPDTIHVCLLLPKSSYSSMSHLAARSSSMFTILIQVFPTPIRGLESFADFPGREPSACQGRQLQIHFIKRRISRILSGLLCGFRKSNCVPIDFGSSQLHLGHLSM